MAARSMKGAMLAAVVIVAATLWTGAVAQSSSSCTNVLVSMSPCLDYIQGNSSKPSSSCCSQLANVVRSQPQCLCEVLNGGASSLGVSVNQTQAMALPTACNVKTPPASQCNGGASKTVPTTDDGISTGNSTKLSFSKLFVLLFIAFQASSFITV
ncbi:PREDICTED: non-specific lipid-transfer protein-like protein At2g13820 isoform X2 [Theobroma cacao]|uniref:Non-specific lipid-transfer protein-like protein At2g13820 isoform X2 n=2 Tax=Theobroma cacao TaxID=3641 RepID=A0AB32VQ00_THECC|nr:PREDICTED: non-specific lipid-transfer protein-like protein At2g13820 isoform X2 [Theobroma cacao]EOX94709.1 Bifunctional inhibitor/lipid-transfer protein/seed storage 2S albumin superfamily protein, putative isoform 2 [Theobroma cacao]